MSGGRIPIGAIAQLMRISNAPTILTNVLVGCALAADERSWDWLRVAAVTYAMLLMYFAGMALNDAADIDIDRRERPSRPIPSGRVPLRIAYLLVAVMMGMALVVLAWLGREPLLLGLALAAAVVLYNFTHAITGFSVILMGACRGLVYLIAAAALGKPVLAAGDAAHLAPALGMTLYVILLSIMARREMGVTIGARRWLALLMPLIALAPAIVLRPTGWTWPLAPGLLLILWQSLAILRIFADPPRTRAAVLGWLAGICLADAFWLTLLDRVELAAVAVGCFLITAMGHRRIAGT